mgnify:FL=1
MNLLYGLEQLGRVDTPLLPDLALAQLWLHLGWGLVLAWLAGTVAGWWTTRRGPAFVLALLLFASALSLIHI